MTGWMGQRSCILALDVGTSAVRAQAWGIDSQPLPGIGSRGGYRLTTDQEGRATLEPGEILSTVAQAIDKTVNLARLQGVTIEAVALDTLAPTLLGVDKKGVPLTPIYTYADTRSMKEAQRIRDKVNTADVHERTGCPVHSSYLPSRLLWLERCQSRIFCRVARWLTLGEFLYWNFFQHYGISYSLASWSGILNRHTLAWDQEWLSQLPLQDFQLSPLRDINDPFTDLCLPWADRWPPLARIPWFPAVGDGASANVGSGCVSPDRVALTIGSTAAIRAVLGKLAIPLPTGLWSYCIDGKRSLLGGATSEGGSIFSWLLDRLNLNLEPDRLEAELGALEPTAHGLVFLPFFAGERSPGWRDDAQASLVGLTLSTRPVEIVRAALESVAYRVFLIHQLMTSNLPGEHEIIGGGAGLLSSPSWLQIVSDVLNRRVTACAEPEVTGRGTAILALESLGLIPNLATVPTVMGRIYDPDPVRHHRHREALERHLEVYECLVGKSVLENSLV